MNHQTPRRIEPVKRGTAGSSAPRPTPRQCRPLVRRVSPHTRFNHSPLPSPRAPSTVYGSVSTPSFISQFAISIRRLFSPSPLYCPSPPCPSPTTTTTPHVHPSLLLSMQWARTVQISTTPGNILVNQCFGRREKKNHPPSVVSSDRSPGTKMNSVALQIDIFGIAVEFASRGAFVPFKPIELRGAILNIGPNGTPV